MTCASIMVVVDADEGARARVRLAGWLADEFRARLIGIDVDQPNDANVSFGPTPGSSYVLARLHEATRDGLLRARTLFEVESAGRSRREWCDGVDSPVHFLLAQAAAADLVVIGRPSLADASTLASPIDPSGIVLGLGRPLLITPTGVEHLEASYIAIGWTNTREARRAVSDALPFLRRAEHILILSVGDAADRVPTLVAYLAAHGIDATAIGVDAEGVDTADALIDAACENAADLLVTGAYGHSRLSEWAFGGVTRDLLATCPICCLMSH
ncbi:universal stress protein [Methylobacterium durans]|uniref:Universal stress protein UspA n=1 Tax=Methylobacterium durans TaxID=2202825 RepID=A0A2U8W0X4_9HYPH|nr:universal stress protein [Methylobacterium durans]AWN39753.1 universal stress protein UspA [Methylobacterium durans]